MIGSLNVGPVSVSVLLPVEEVVVGFEIEMGAAGSSLRPGLAGRGRLLAPGGPQVLRYS